MVRSKMVQAWKLRHKAYNTLLHIFLTLFGFFENCGSWLGPAHHYTVGCPIDNIWLGISSRFSYYNLVANKQSTVVQSLWMSCVWSHTLIRITSFHTYFKVLDSIILYQYRGKTYVGSICENGNGERIRYNIVSSLHPQHSRIIVKKYNVYRDSKILPVSVCASCRRHKSWSCILFNNTDTNKRTCK